MLHTTSNRWVCWIIYPRSYSFQGNSPSPRVLSRLFCGEDRTDRTYYKNTAERVNIFIRGMRPDINIVFGTPALVKACGITPRNGSDNQHKIHAAFHIEFFMERCNWFLVLLCWPLERAIKSNYHGICLTDNFIALRDTFLFLTEFELSIINIASSASVRIDSRHGLLLSYFRFIVILLWSCKQ